MSVGVRDEVYRELEKIFFLISFRILLLNLPTDEYCLNDVITYFSLAPRKLTRDDSPEEWRDAW
jgi:hypothetical protein